MQRRKKWRLRNNYKIGVYNKNMNKKIETILTKAESFEKDDKFWQACSTYEELLKILNETENTKKIQKLKIKCKDKILETSQKRAENFQKVQFSTNINEKEIQNIENEIESIFKGKKLNQILDTIGKIKHFCPSYESVSQRAIATKPLSLQIAKGHVQDERGHIIKDGSNLDKAWMMKNYQINQQIISNLYLDPIFIRISKKKNKDKEFYKYFKDKKTFLDQDIEIICHAIERFFKKDYISFLHIAVPRFESVFLYFTKKINPNINNLACRQDSSGVFTEVSTLGESFLDQDDVINVWGKDFCEQIKFILFSKLGMSLRHEIAHGYLNSKKMNFSNSVIILYLYINMAANITNNLTTK